MFPKKMIVSDLDGTLMNRQKELSDRTKAVLKQLIDQGVIFAAASGRSRKSQMEIFKDLPIASISDNGSTVYDHQGNLVWYKEVPKEVILEACEVIEPHAFIHPIFCGLKKHYVLASDSEEAKAYASFFFNGHVETVRDIQEVYEKDVVVKLSLHTNVDGSEEKEGLAIVGHFADRITVTLSGDGWIDLTAQGASKGNGYEELCRYLSICPEETMMFADYLNDLEMVKRCPDAWCMKNGHPDVKKLCQHVTRYTNEEDGVAVELEELLFTNQGLS